MCRTSATTQRMGMDLLQYYFATKCVVCRGTVVAICGHGREAVLVGFSLILDRVRSRVTVWGITPVGPVSWQRVNWLLFNRQVSRHTSLPFSFRITILLVTDSPC